MDSGASMHNAEQRRVKLRYNWILWEGPKNHIRLAADWSSANKRVSTIFLHDFDLFVSVQVLDETPAILLLHQLCSKRGNSYEWKTAKLHNWPQKREKTITCIMDTFCASRCTRIVIIFQQHFVFNIEIKGSVLLFQENGNIIRSSDNSKWQACMRETDADRSWQAGHGEPWTNRRDEHGRSNARHSCLVTALHSSSRGPEYMCSHIPLKEWTQIRKLTLQKWRYKNGSTVFMLTFAKTKKRSILRAEKYGDKKTAEHRVLNEGRESRNNHRNAAVLQILATQRNPCQTKTSQETEKNSTRVYRNRLRSQKLFIRTIYLEFGKYCEELSWYYRTTTLHRSETSGIAERAVYVEQKETSAVLLQSGSDDKWWSDSMECYCCLRDDRDLLADEKSQNERRFGESFKDMLCSRGEFAKKILWLLRLRKWKSWMHQKYVPEEWIRRKSW